MKDKLTRRQALKGTMTSAAAGMTIVKPSTAFSYQANSAVSFGIIGTGGRGSYVGTFMAQDKNARLAAICDKFPDKIDNAKTKIPGADKVPAYRDMNELLAKPDIDAVLIATPVYLHPEHFEVAVQSGKHIYCEKPGGADVAGCKRLMRAGEKANKERTIQFGYQQRFSPEYLTAMEYLKTGRIGEMKLMMSYWVLGGVPPAPQPGAQKSFGQLTDEEKIRSWGRWEETSGGPIVEQDCHGVDTLNWFAMDVHPVKAWGTAGLRYPVASGDWKTDYHNIAFYYPNGIEGWLISIKHTAGYRDVKEQLYGSKGMLETSRKYYRLHGPEGDWRYPNADDLRDRSLIEKRDSPREITIDAVEAFFKSIIEKKPYHMWKSSAESTLTAIMGRMAVHQKREITWDEMMRSA